MRKPCPVCTKPFSKYLMENKPVCLSCDELTFDLEIEREEESRAKKGVSQLSEEGTKSTLLAH